MSRERFEADILKWFKMQPDCGHLTPAHAYKLAEFLKQAGWQAHAESLEKFWKDFENRRYADCKHCTAVNIAQSTFGIPYCGKCLLMRELVDDIIREKSNLARI